MVRRTFNNGDNYGQIFRSLAQRQPRSGDGEQDPEQHRSSRRPSGWWRSRSRAERWDLFWTGIGWAVGLAVWYGVGRYVIGR
jgi:hypothetical protein